MAVLDYIIDENADSKNCSLYNYNQSTCIDHSYILDLVKPSIAHLDVYTPTTLTGLLGGSIRTKQFVLSHENAEWMKRGARCFVRWLRSVNPVLPLACRQNATGVNATLTARIHRLERFVRESHAHFRGTQGDAR